MPSRAREIANEGVCLVVEDSRFDQRVLVRALHHAGTGANIIVADTLRSARGVLSRQHVRFILLDNTLPDGHGADFALELAMLPDFRNIPVMLVTGWPSPFMYEKAKKAGVRSVIDKDEIGAEQIARFLSG